MSKPEQITGWVIVGTACALIVYDVVAADLWGTSATESEVLLNAAHRAPIIPFALGVLFGHFFASQIGEAWWHTDVPEPPLIPR